MIRRHPLRNKYAAPSVASRYPVNSGFSRSRDLQQVSASELLRLCLDSRQADAWSEFVRRSQPVIAVTVIRSIRRWTNPLPQTVDDLVQETYLKLCMGDFKALRKFEFLHEQALWGYLRVVASNVVQDHFRNRLCRKRGSGKVEENSELLTSGIPSPENFAEKMEQRILLGRIRNCLKTHSSDAHFSRNYAIFWLYFEKGLTAQAIAELPFIDLGTKGVESVLLRLTTLAKEALSRPSAIRLKN